MNQGDLDAVLDRTPDLCGSGFAYRRSGIPFDEDRKQLRGYLEEVRHCVAWLKAPLIPSSYIGVSRRRQWFNSYSLKHMAERSDCPGGYVCNGALIAAAIYLGLPMKDRDGPNVMIKIPVRST